MFSLYWYYLYGVSYVHTGDIVGVVNYTLNKNHPEQSVFAKVLIDGILLSLGGESFYSRLADLSLYRSRRKPEKAPGSQSKRRHTITTTRDTVAPRMLVIRGVDEEAASTLSTGAIGARLGHLILIHGIETLFGVVAFLFDASLLVTRFRRASDRPVADPVVRWRCLWRSGVLRSSWFV
jgi:hypothetical protein